MALMDVLNLPRLLRSASLVEEEGHELPTTAIKTGVVERFEFLESDPVVIGLKARLGPDDSIPLIPLPFRPDHGMAAPTIALTRDGFRICWEPYHNGRSVEREALTFEKLTSEILEGDAIDFNALNQILEVCEHTSTWELRSMRRGRDFKCEDLFFGEDRYDTLYQRVTLNTLRASPQARGYCQRVEQLFEACGETFLSLQHFLVNNDSRMNPSEALSIQAKLTERGPNDLDLRTLLAGLYFKVLDLEDGESIRCPTRLFFYMTEDPFGIAGGPVRKNIVGGSKDNQNTPNVPISEVSFSICHTREEIEEFVAMRSQLPSDQQLFICPFGVDELLDKNTFTVFLARNKQGEPIGAGFALSGGMLTNVFSLPGLGLGETVVRAAVEAGATDLYMLDVTGHLESLYTSCGFKKVASWRGNPTFLPKDWDEARFGIPDYVHMIFDDLSFARAAIARNEWAPRRAFPPIELEFPPVLHGGKNWRFVTP